MGARRTRNVSSPACCVCDASNQLMALRYGKVYCYSCLAVLFNYDAKLVVSYLAQFKHVEAFPLPLTLSERSPILGPGGGGPEGRLS